MSNSELSQSMVVFGLHLWELVGIGVGAAFVLLLVLFSLLCLVASRRRRRRRGVPVATPVLHLTTVAPNAHHPKHPGKPPKDIQEVPSRGGGEPGVPKVSHLGWGHWYMQVAVKNLLNNSRRRTKMPEFWSLWIIVLFAVANMRICSEYLYICH